MNEELYSGRLRCV